MSSWRSYSLKYELCLFRWERRCSPAMTQLTRGLKLLLLFKPQAKRVENSFSTIFCYSLFFQNCMHTELLTKKYASKVKSTSRLHFRLLIVFIISSTQSNWNLKFQARRAPGCTLLLEVTLLWGILVYFTSIFPIWWPHNVNIIYSKVKNI